MTSTLLPSLPAVYDILFDFAQSDGFWANLETAFGTSYDVVKATQLRQQWQSRDFSQLPPITVKNLGNSGIFGAYSSSINKIYISQALIDSGDATTLKAVLLEEIGHFIDAQINSSDTPGDEGQLFSALVRGEVLTEEQIAAIREENDAATITVDGQAISVEMAFGTPTNFSVGTSPVSVTVGDFNGDGKSDLAVANYNSNNVSVLLGTGTGSFGAATNFTVGSSPYSVAVGDFNGDGKSDLATANFNSNVSVLLGTGTGSFGAATNFTVGNGPISVRVGDFNGDGKSDLATTNGSGYNVSVILNTTPKITIAPGTNPVEGGTVGTFIISLDTPAPTGGTVVNFNTTGSTATILADYSLTAGTNITAVTANTFTIAAGATTATLNVVALSDAVNDPNETVKVNLTSGGDYILGYNPSASFTPPTNFAAGSSPISVTVGDFNGDGKSDLAVANRGSNNVSVLLGTGTGSFGAATNFSVGNAPSSVTVGDFNGDGKSDLAVANRYGNNVSVLLGTGTGSFGTATNFSVGIFPVSVTVGDFNGDGKSDLATANGSSNNVSVRLGTGAGSFGTATNFSVGTGPASVTVGDFNGDGKSDLAVANANSSNVSVLLGTGTGSFGPATNFTVGSFPYSVTVGDFNGDGKSDLAVANAGSSNVSVLLGTGTGSFGTATNFTVGTVPRSVTVGDFNGDGKSDLAVANGSNNNVSVLLGTGTGSFGPATNFTVGSSPRSVAVGDFNGDGKSDLATANYNGGNVSVFLNADPTATVTITDVSQPPISLTINDVTVTEGNSGTTNAVFTVSLSSAASTVVSVNYATANGTATAGTDYTALPPTTLTFNPGETSKTITVPVNGDNQVELNETFFLNLSNLQANGSNVILADNQGQGTITNDDSASIAISDVTITEGNSGTTNAVFTVTLSNAVDTAVTVNYATANGTATTTDNDYTAIAATPLIFNAGETSKTITVAVNGDNQVESNETFFVNLSNLQTNGRNVTLADNQGQGTILNDDTSVTLAVSPSSVTEDGTSNLIYTFTRSGVTSNALTVNYSIGGTATNGTDYASIPTGVTFAANLATATVTINPTADTIVESNETVILTLAAGTGYTIGTTTPVTGTINNDDTSVTSQLSINDITVVEGKDNNAILTVTVDNPNSQPITFNYTTAPINATANVDYTSKTGTITIAANTSTATISIPILNDNLNEPDEVFTVTLSNPVNATINPDEAIGQVIITDTLQSAITRTLPNNVENLRLIGTNNINGTGNAGNNNITGNSGINQINGGAGIDTLTGGLGADTFIFQFGQSTISASDRITDFAINSDKIDLLTQGGTATSAPSNFSRAANSTVTTLQNLVNQVFTDANGATTGNQELAVNSAALVQVTTGAIAGTYLVINDSTAGFQSSNDLLINITGFTGTLPALGSIPVGNFFV
ncbi:beta strand repeat-containing protein [Microcystis sp.]|uniref:beta strand repeat-containing protein n=1 Tax=Microcystis sp. TaxID=1127 RepID=UPI00391C44BC